MPSILEMNIPGTPNGEYMTVITNPIDVTLPPVFAESIEYISGIAETSEIDFDIGTALVGFLIDNESVHVNGGVISGLSITPPLNLINLEEAVDAHYSLSTEWVAQNDWELSIDLYPNTISQNAIGGTNSTFIRLKTASEIDLVYKAGTLVVVNLSTAIPISQLSKLRVRSVGTTITIYLNGGSVGSVPRTAGALKVDTLGQKGGGNHFDGILSNAKLTDLTNPMTNSLEFELGNLTGNTEVNNGVTLTYNNIATTDDVRFKNYLSNDSTQWISDLRTIDIAPQIEV
jgi:hypothetical protein